jgi:stage II sporulation protein D
MRKIYKYLLIALICLPTSCCFIVRPPKIIEEPQVAIAVLWNTDTIYVKSKNPITTTSQDKTVNIPANTTISITDTQDNILVLMNNKVVLTNASKITCENQGEISVGSNPKTMLAYHRNIQIKKGVMHRFPVSYDLTAINTLPIEEYLYGVVSCEIGEADESEYQAIKAQAVCARSYTMSLLGVRNDFDLYGSYLYDQEYQGSSREYPLVIKAVNETRGEIMQYKDAPILAQYHACCGGRTTAGRYPYLQSIIDAPYHSNHEKPYCKDSPYFEWNIKIPRDSFDSAILKLAGITYKFRFNPKLEINKKTKRAQYFKFKAEKEYKVSAESFRKALNLKSTFYSCKIKNDWVEINGHGWGHGIGLCQYGAMGMAQEKISYKNILKHYYSKVKFVRMF